jgi:hypothetical protein
MKYSSGTYSSVSIAASYFADQTQQAGSEEGPVYTRPGKASEQATCCKWSLASTEASSVHTRSQV